mgnify:CR=1 FL=1
MLRSVPIRNVSPELWNGEWRLLLDELFYDHLRHFLDVAQGLIAGMPPRRGAPTLQIWNVCPPDVLVGFHDDLYDIGSHAFLTPSLGETG